MEKTSTEQTPNQGDLSKFLNVTEYCDWSNPALTTASKNIFHPSVFSGRTSSDRARRAFYWVRDHIKYTLGLKPDRASETLRLNSGSCSNKANLLAALLRCQGIPTGFMLMEVKTKDYFGPTSIPRLNQFLSQKSLHVFNSVYLNGQWIHVDATDDLRMSTGFWHLSPTCRPVEFDGTQPALLNIDPQHILSISPTPLPSIDFVFEKTRRHTHELLDIYNLYLEFLRDQGIRFNSIKDLEAEFFFHLRQSHPRLFEHLLSLEASRGASPQTQGPPSSSQLSHPAPTHLTRQTQGEQGLSS